MDGGLMRVRNIVWAGLFGTIIAIPQVSQAEEEFQSGKIHLYGSVDVFLPGNAGDGLWDDTQVGMKQLSGIGYSSVGSIQTDAAVGGRIGIMAQVTESFDIGFSGGYISGPNSDSSVRAVSGAQSATLSDKREVSFVRFLIEPTFNMKMSDITAFHLGAGLGVAEGRTEETISCTGNACVVNGNLAKNASSWTGFTWEISPYFSVKNFLFGGRYAGFPKFKGNNNNSKIEWTSAGLFTGFKF
jgi:hypothetical protein